jgi:signal transduction histidine kinase
VFALAAVFGVYVLAGKAGLALAFVNASASAVWPPTGIALAAALVLGTRVWPAIALGAFVVNVTTAGSPLSSLSIATGNTLEALVAAALVRRYANGIHAFDRPQDVLKFTMLAAAGTAISATIGVTTLGVGGYAAWADFGAIWLTWWLGDISGALIVAPTVVLWATRLPALPEDAGRRIELAGLVVVAVMVALVTFGPVGPLGPQHYPITFLPFPILVWAAFRFGPLQAASLISLLSVIAIGGTLQGAGPFGAYPPNDALVLLQAFTTVATLTTLTLGAAVLDRDRAQERARQAEERLRRAEEQKVLAREEFLSVAAHELKTPMTTLHIAVQSLLRQLDREGAVDTGALRRALAAVRENTDKLARLVTELLETARANVGRLELERAEADITALVATAVERAQARAPRRRFSLTSRPPPLPSTVDALRLEQVLDNVLDNAIKFSPEGGAIEVTLALTAPQQVRITVRDHGVGIPLERRARIFERFYQAHLELQRSGLGLGLYVAREIVQLHGGRIVAEFPDDGGTRIVIDLPLSREARPADTGVVAATRER